MLKQNNVASRQRRTEVIKQISIPETDQRTNGLLSSTSAKRDDVEIVLLRVGVDVTVKQLVPRQNESPQSRTQLKLRRVRPTAVTSIS